MRISIDITGADERTLTEAAERFNVPADELAAAALSDFLYSLVFRGPYFGSSHTDGLLREEVTRIEEYGKRNADRTFSKTANDRFPRVLCRATRRSRRENTPADR